MLKTTVGATLAAIALTSTGIGWIATAHADLPATGSFGVPAEIPIGAGSVEALTTGSAGGTADTAGGTGSAGIPADTQLHWRAALYGADRPDAVRLAHESCAIMRTNPNILGKQDALDHLRAAGVPAGSAAGGLLGTAVDLYCPDMTPVVW